MATGDDARLDALDRVTLTRIVQRALDRGAIQLREWSWTPIAYDRFLPGRLLARLSGTARVAGGDVAWSLVLKHSWPADAQAGGPNAGARREALAYASGLLAALPGGLAAPRCFEVREDASGALWLWLEEVADDHDRRWPLAQFVRAARDLGRFNGAYLTSRPLPTFAWLRGDWTALHSEPALIPAGRDDIAARATDPRVRHAFPDRSPGQVAQLLDDQPHFVAALDRLPQTLCHHDASQPNLFARRVGRNWRTVAIDWESLGPGALGADLATLVFGSVRRGAYSAGRLAALDRVAFVGYLRGLQEAGWRGDPTLPRLGYCAAVALRWFLLRGTLRALTGADSAQRGAVAESAARARRQFVLLARFLLDRADEARNLMRRLGP